jgi:hypothetical protein
VIAHFRLHQLAHALRRAFGRRLIDPILTSMMIAARPAMGATQKMVNRSNAFECIQNGCFSGNTAPKIAILDHIGYKD